MISKQIGVRQKIDWENYKKDHPQYFKADEVKMTAREWETYTKEMWTRNGGHPSN